MLKQHYPHSTCGLRTLVTTFQASLRIVSLSDSGGSAHARLRPRDPNNRCWRRDHNQPSVHISRRFRRGFTLHLNSAIHFSFLNSNIFLLQCVHCMCACLQDLQDHHITTVHALWPLGSRPRRSLWSYWWSLWLWLQQTLAWTPSWLNSAARRYGKQGHAGSLWSKGHSLFFTPTRNYWNTE